MGNAAKITISKETFEVAFAYAVADADVFAEVNQRTLDGLVDSMWTQLKQGRRGYPHRS